MEKYIEIKGEKIPIILRNYKNTRKVKMYYRGNILNISKPYRMTKKELCKIITEYENQLYVKYKDIISKDSQKIKHWFNGETILYKGEEYKININKIDNEEINININEIEKIIFIDVYNQLVDNNIAKKYIDKEIKKVLQKNTKEKIENRLQYWSQKTNIKYDSFKVRDAISKYGSCKPKTRELMFTSRLIMLPEDKIDAIIVHELCHIIYPNHSKDFYNLVKRYIPNYEEINKWLKINSNKISI